MMKQTLFLTAAMICLLFCACKKEDTNPNGSKVTLPLTVDFTSQSSIDSAKAQGIVFSFARMSWRDGNCSSDKGTSTITTRNAYFSLWGKDYLSNSSIICNISKIKNLQRIKLNMNAKSAWDYDTMQPLISALVTICNGSGVVAEVDTPASQVLNQSGWSLSQKWQLDVNGQSAERLSISSDDAIIYSVTFE